MVKPEYLVRHLYLIFCQIMSWKSNVCGLSNLTITMHMQQEKIWSHLATIAAAATAAITHDWNIPQGLLIHPSIKNILSCTFCNFIRNIFLGRNIEIALCYKAVKNILGPAMIGILRAWQAPTFQQIQWCSPVRTGLEGLRLFGHVELLSGIYLVWPS